MCEDLAYTLPIEIKIKMCSQGEFSDNSMGDLLVLCSVNFITHMEARFNGIEGRNLKSEIDERWCIFVFCISLGCVCVYLKELDLYTFFSL